MRTFSRTALTGAVAVFAAVLVFRFLAVEIPAVFFAMGIETAVAAGILLSAAALGDLLVAGTGFPVRAGFERLFFAGTLGLGALGTVVALFGFTGMLRVPFLAGTVALPLLLRRRAVGEMLQGVSDDVRDRCTRGHSLTGTAALVATAAALAATCLAAYVPPMQYDSLVYHLALPGAYLREGRVFAVPYNLYTHFPQLTEMLFMVGMALCDDVVPSLLSCGALLLLCMGVVAFAEGHRDGRTGLVAVLLLCTAPASVFLASSSYVEVILALFTFAALYAVVRAVTETADDRVLRSAAVAGLYAGCALSAKYTGGITVVVVTGILAVTGFAAGRAGRGVKNAVVAAAAAGMVFAPWALKNIIVVGNPVFPFLYDLIGYRNVAWTEASARGYFAMLTEYRHHGNVLAELLRLPFALIDRPTSFGGGADVLGDGGWPLLCVLVPLAVFARGLTPGMAVALAFGVVHFLVWFAAKPVLRFLYPMYPVGALVAAVGCLAAGDRGGAVVRAAIRVVCGLFFLVHGITVLGVFDRMGTLRPVLGLESRDVYRAVRLSHSPYPAWRWLEHHADHDARVLLVGDQRAHGCPRRCVAPSVFAPNPLVSWADNAQDAAALADTLRAQGYSHVVLNEGEGRRLHEGYAIFNFSPHGAAVWREFRASMPAVFSACSVTVYRLQP